MSGQDRNGSSRVRSSLWARTALGSAVLTTLGVPSQASILADVLERIAAMGQSPLAAVMINAAINEPRQMLTPQKLASGQRVILGYDLQGRPVEGIAGPSGILVTPAMVQNMQSGLSAGLYPPGSALYSLPPAGQLSLYEADRRGARLELATASALAVVDGSVTNIIQAALLPDLAPVRVLAAGLGRDGLPMLELDKVTTTVLGAVNSGEIVTAVQVKTGPDAYMDDIDRARIAFGGSIAVSEATTSDVSARMLTLEQIGGGNNTAAVAANIAVNLGDVRGQVTTIVYNQSSLIASISTTVIGAVNSGLVDSESRPEANASE